MSLLVRAPLRQVARSGASARFMSSGHHPNQVPFAYQNRLGFGAKLTAYLVVGFSVPFVAAAFQLRKSGGAA